jgi:hypothetical protein
MSAFNARDKTSWHKGLPVVKTIYTYGFHELFLNSCFSYWIYHVKCIFNRVRVIVFLLMEETWVPRETHWPAASHWQTLSYDVVSSTPRLSGFELTILVVMGTDCIGSNKSNYYAITTAHIFNNIFVIL